MAPKMMISMKMGYAHRTENANQCIDACDAMRDKCKAVQFYTGACVFNCVLLTANALQVPAMYVVPDPEFRGDLYNRVEECDSAAEASIDTSAASASAAGFMPVPERPCFTMIYQKTLSGTPKGFATVKTAAECMDLCAGMNGQCKSVEYNADMPRDNCIQNYVGINDIAGAFRDEKPVYKVIFYQLTEGCVAGATTMTYPTTMMTYPTTTGMTYPATGSTTMMTYPATGSTMMTYPVTGSTMMTYPSTTGMTYPPNATTTPGPVTPMTYPTTVGVAGAPAPIGAPAPGK